jgi:Na+-driven multidrug efflux pump
MPLNPVVIVLSFLFWGWLWGVPGMLLAVPILAAPAALATAGQALGHGSLQDAKEHAKRVLRTGTIAGLILGLALIGMSFLLPVVCPRVKKDVLGMANWGVLITAFVQWAKVLNSALGTGILPSGGDTKFVLFSHVISSYAIGLPVAALTAIGLRLGTWSVFGSRALEEVVRQRSYCCDITLPRG